MELPSTAYLPRVSRHPKSYLVETGLAAHLLGVTPERLAEPTTPATGALVETFAVNELVRQASRFADELGMTLYHYRAHTGPEIDVVAEADDGRVVCIEVKAGASVDTSDFSHLAAVRDRLDELPEELVRGVVLYTGNRFHYTGNRFHGFGDRLEGLPLASLWLSAP